MRIQTTLAATVAIAALLAPATASAVRLERHIIEQASGLCGANNPANDTYLRRLPTGLRNTGLANVSVVCSQWGDDTTTVAASIVYIAIRNDKPAGANVTCTLTMGTPYYTQVAHTRTSYVAAGGTAYLNWDTDNFGLDADKQWINLQCSLPPGFSMRDIKLQYEEEVGL